MSTLDSEIYYDPYDFEIDSDPYPVWRRLRQERPLYYNERYDFYALSRFDDVERCFVDWRTYLSSRGSVIEIIKSGMEIPPGSIIFEDPPTHDLHRGLLSRVFTLARSPPLNQRCASSVLAASTLWLAPAGSTSSGTWAPRCRCERSECSSASRSRIRRPSGIASTKGCG